jgi:hypothetical protein
MKFDQNVIYRQRPRTAICQDDTRTRVVVHRQQKKILFVFHIRTIQ